MIDLSNWIPQAEAAERLQVSTKTIAKWAEEGKLQRRKRPRRGKKAEPVYCPSDIERLEAERHPAVMEILPELAGQRNLEDVPTIWKFGVEGFQILAQAVGRVRRDPYLTVEQAARRRGLSQALVRRAIAARALPSIRDRAIKVLASDVDDLDVPSFLSTLPPKKLRAKGASA